MKEHEIFLRQLDTVRKSLLRERMVGEAQLFLVSGAVFSFLLFSVARFIPIPYLERYFFIGIPACLSFSILHLFRTKPGRLEAAKLANRYVEEDRVLSAFHFLNDSSPVSFLLIRDAVFSLERELPRIRNREKRWFYPLRLVTSSLLILLSLWMVSHPNGVMEAASRKEQEMEVLKDFRKKTKEEIEKEKDVNRKEELARILEKLQDADHLEELWIQLEERKKETRLERFREEEKHYRMENWANRFEKTGLKELADSLRAGDSKAMERVLEKLEKDADTLTPGQKQVLSDFARSFDEEVFSPFSILKRGLAELASASRAAERLKSQEEKISQWERELLAMMEQAGLKEADKWIAGKETVPSGTSGNREISPPRKGTGTESGKNPSGENSKEAEGESGNPPDEKANAGKGQPGGNLQGDHGGSVDREGEKGASAGIDGSNGGSISGGNGGSAGIGSGSGSGFGSAEREFLTLPERIGGPVNLEGDFGPLGKGKPKALYEGNGPAFRGSLRPYWEAYPEYREAYLRSVERADLPSDLERIVKDYLQRIQP